MKERPILFSGPMVRAILEGRKTQTRRIVSPKFIECFGDPVFHYGHGTDGLCWYVSEEDYPEEGSLPLRCPYGQPGDRLWVRETFLAFDDDWRHVPRKTALRDGPWGNLVYRASAERPADSKFRWLPSIYMPRWASRITLEITGVHVERLQEISEADAQAEGIVRSEDPGLRSWPYLGAAHPIKGTPKVFATGKRAFESLWDSINAERAPWTSNPWVWVIEFKRAGA